MGYTGEQKREYQREWMATRRREWIDAHGGKCVKCGSTQSLEIDHIDRSQKALHIGGIWSRSESVREAELAKCQILCGGCHLEKTIAERLTDHGTIGRYSRGCGCEDCREANRARVRKQRQ